LPFNVADEVSCRAGAIKCSRCRASFAPIRTAFAERNLDPPLDRSLADPLSETKNCRNLLTGKCGSQVSHSLPAHLERFIGDEPVPDTWLGLNENRTGRIAFDLLAKVGDINAEILGALQISAPDFAEDVAMREDATRMPNDNRSSAYSVAVSLISRPFLIETRSPPGSLAPTLVTLPSMSLLPVAPFLLPICFLVGTPSCRDGAFA